jgi:hypothetical protein
MIIKVIMFCSSVLGIYNLIIQEINIIFLANNKLLISIVTTCFLFIFYVLNIDPSYYKMAYQTIYWSSAGLTVRADSWELVHMSKAVYL